MKLDSSQIIRSNRFLVYLHAVMLRFIYLFIFDKDVSLAVIYKKCIRLCFRYGMALLTAT